MACCHRKANAQELKLSCSRDKYGYAAPGRCYRYCRWRPASARLAQLEPRAPVRVCQAAMAQLTAEYDSRSTVAYQLAAEVP